MLRALGRKAFADLRGQRLQGIVIVLTVAAATATLVLALTLRASSSNPWERVFAETNGAHVNLYVHPGTDVTPVQNLDGVAESAGPFPTIWDQRVVNGLDKEELALFGFPADPPAVERPRVVDGRWLGGGEREIVLDRSTAQALNAGVGDTVEFLTPRGKVSLLVVGLAVTGNWGSYPDWDPGLGFVLPATLSLLEPNQDAWTDLLAVRLDDPELSEAFVTEATAALPPSAVAGYDTWQEIQENLDFNNAIFVVLLSTFSLFALFAAGLVIANAIGGRVLAQGREIGLLKAIGFTPRGVAMLFLVEHLVLGLLGGLLGVGAGLVVAPRLLSRAADVLDTTASPSFDPVMIAGALIAVLVLVVLFTLFPAWRAGRIPTVQAIATGVGGAPSGRSRLATLAARLRLPAVVVLGFKDAFARRMRAWMTVWALALTVVCAVAALGVEATARQLIDDPSGTGGALGMIVERGDVPEADARGLLTERPEVDALMTVLGEDATAVVGTERVDLDVRAIGGSYEQIWPRLLEGRMFAAPGEAIAGRGLLTLLGLEIGDTARVTVNGQPLTITIVGRYWEVDNDGRVLTFGFDTLHDQIDPALEPDSYGLKLVPGTDREALKTELVRASDDQFEVLVVSAGTFEEDVNQFRIVLAGLAGALLLLGLGNLMTTALLGVRERTRDVGVLKALGCTPRQIVASVVVGVGVLAVIGVAAGIPLGLVVSRALADWAGEGTGFGREFGRTAPWTWLLALAPAAMLLATLAGTIPARRAATLRVTEALRAE